MQPTFILASASPRRLRLLQQIGLTPSEVIPADIDESPLRGELPQRYATRIAASKAEVVAVQHPDSIILAADTVVACGRRILPKAENEASARACLTLLSGRRHRVYTALCVRRGKISHASSAMTQVRMSRLSESDIEAYVQCREWEGKAGGYAIQGKAEAFIPWISGSFSNVVGLPLAETRALLVKIGGVSW